MSEELKEIGQKADKTKQDLKSRIADIEARQKQYEEKTESAIMHAPNVWTPTRSGTNYEAQVLRSFGARHVKDLLSTDISAPRYKGIDEGMKQAALALKENVDIARWISQIFYGEKKDSAMIDRPVEVKGMLDHAFGREVLAPMLKSFDSGTSSTGGAWIPTGISTQFEGEFELERRWLQIMQSMNMPTNPFKLPVQSNVTVARKSTEKTSMTDANFQTATIDFDAFKLAEFYCLGSELTEDSAPNILQIARLEVVESQQRAREQILANGDDSGTHMDSDTDAGAADLAEKCVKGLRKLALDNSANGGDVDFAGAGVTTAKLDEMRTNMGKFGVNPRDLVIVFGPSGYNQAVALDEVTSVEKFGGQATILTGVLGAFRGAPVVVSDYVREDLAADGTHDGVTVDKTVCLMFHKRRFWWGVRRPIRSRVMMDLPQDDQWLLASYSRIDFKGHAQGADETSVVVGRNIQV